MMNENFGANDLKDLEFSDSEFFFTYAKNETFANQTNKNLGAKIQRRKKWILWRKNSNIHRKNNCYLGPKWDILNWVLKTVWYFLTDITEYDLRNTFAHMKAWVATEDEMSDWQTHFCCAARCFDSSDPPSSNRKAHRFTLCRSSNGFLPSVEAKKKSENAAPVFTLFAKK